jgi:hypothetical protein
METGFCVCPEHSFLGGFHAFGALWVKMAENGPVDLAHRQLAKERELLNL